MFFPEFKALVNSLALLVRVMGPFITQIDWWTMPVMATDMPKSMSRREVSARVRFAVHAWLSVPCL